MSLSRQLAMQILAAKGMTVQFSEGVVQCLSHQYGAQYSVHVWSKALRQPGFDAEVHNHPFNFESLILHGSLEHKRYRLVKRGGVGLHAWHVNPLLRELRYLGPVRMRPQVERFSRGTRYALRKVTVHSATASGDDAAITIVKRAQFENLLAGSVMFSASFNKPPLIFEFEPWIETVARAARVEIRAAALELLINRGRAGLLRLERAVRDVAETWKYIRPSGPKALIAQRSSFA